MIIGATILLILAAITLVLAGAFLSASSGEVGVSACLMTICVGAALMAIGVGLMVKGYNDNGIAVVAQPSAPPMAPVATPLVRIEYGCDQSGQPFFSCGGPRTSFSCPAVQTRHD